MSCIIIPENFRSPNSTLLVHLCRVLKIKHTANRIFVVCFIEAHGKGDGQPNAVTGRHLCRVSSFRHTAKIHVYRVSEIRRGLFGLAHGIYSLCRVRNLCRVPDVWPTANVSAHGKHRFSGSDISRGTGRISPNSMYDADVNIKGPIIC